mmetsp:Transcript_19820/g.32534  ORF Transcript_19820/g.32534 Transcript_19820/m.32534 type:complete len:84 (-) Transcript_19820:573-824(-)
MIWKDQSLLLLVVVDDLWEYLIGSNVTTPPDCAPLIMVTLTIFSSTSNAVLPPSIDNHDEFNNNTPKLPQKKVLHWLPILPLS